MSACIALDDALPALTSRLLLLMEDEKDLLLVESRPSSTTIPPRLLEETKEPDEVFLLDSPNHHKASLQHPRYDNVPELALPITAKKMPNPKTPLSTAKGLFVSFPSSPMPQDLWQYEKEQPFSSFLTPRTTDAVFLGTKRAATATADWSPTRSSSSNNNNHQASTDKNVNTLPLAPSLYPNCDANDSPPTIIRCRARSGSYSSFSGFDDDEVSLLADDPDEDDAGVLPPSTYNVVVDILDQIDRDN